MGYLDRRASFRSEFRQSVKLLHLLSHKRRDNELRVSDQLTKYLSSRTGSHSLFEQLHTGLFSFADITKPLNLAPSSIFLCSFDISSLFSNVPFTENIQICADAFYSSEHPPAPFPRQIFVKLMEMATSSVEFSFDGIMHCHIDGVVMGSPLGPALANIFLCCYESKLFQTTGDILPIKG